MFIYLNAWIEMIPSLFSRCKNFVIVFLQVCFLLIFNFKTYQI